MAAANYDEAVRRLLAHEGGYTNHPADPGGPTNFGITLDDYRRYVDPAANAADVRAMKLAEAKTIYRQRYWNALRCDELPGGVDYAVFDYGVNSGVGRASRVLRRVLGLPDDTSTVTNMVVTATRERDAADLVTAICGERLAFLKRLETWPVFGTGWGRRVAEVRAASLAMAGKRMSPGATKTPAPGKAGEQINRAAQNGSAGAVVAAGAAAAQQAHQSGAGSAVVAAIAAAAVLLALGVWLAWRWRHKRQHNAAR